MEHVAGLFCLFRHFVGLFRWEWTGSGSSWGVVAFRSVFMGLVGCRGLSQGEETQSEQGSSASRGRGVVKRFFEVYGWQRGRGYRTDECTFVPHDASSNRDSQQDPPSSGPATCHHLPPAASHSIPSRYVCVGGGGGYGGQGQEVLGVEGVGRGGMVGGRAVEREVRADFQPRALRTNGTQGRITAEEGGAGGGSEWGGGGGLTLLLAN